MTSRIFDLAKPFLEYDMIQTYTELPNFPSGRTNLLLAFLNGGAPAAERSDHELFALVTSLVQVGLDTHDLVPPTNADKGKSAARSRQLKVLAGDYFSSRYYHLLSQAGKIDVVAQLAGAICEVNRLKMNLYTRMKQLKMTAEDYIQQTVRIKSQLYLSFRPIMEGKFFHAWPDVLHSFTKCEVLIDEWFRAESGQRLHGSWAFWHIMQYGTKEDKRLIQQEEPEPGKLRALLLKYKASAVIYQLIEEQVLQLWAKFRKMDADFSEELIRIGEPLSKYLPKPKVLEEI